MKRPRRSSESGGIGNIDLLDLGEFLGSGTFSSVFASKKYPREYVYRVEVVSMDIQREYAIQDLLSTSHLGPCFPLLFAHGIFNAIQDLDTRIRVRLKGDYIGPNTMVSVAQMEAGNDGELRIYNEKELTNFAFMLFWSYWTANSQFGFRHRDLKPENIVVKRLVRKVHYVFRLDGQNTLFHIKTDRVPLIIDYGMASLLTTRREKQFANGTPLYVSPEIIAQQLTMDSAVNLHVSGNQYFNDDAYDVWGLALSLLFSYGDTGLIAKIQDLSKNFQDSILLRQILGDERFARLQNLKKRTRIFQIRMHSVLYSVCMLQKALGNGITPSQELIGTVYPHCVFNRNVKKFLETLDKNLGYSKGLKDLIRNQKMSFPMYMFAWDPGERIFNGELARLLLQLDVETTIDTPEKTRPAQEIFSSRLRPLFDSSTDEAFRTKQFQALSNVKYIRSQVCEVCSETPARYVCMCCSTVLCGMQCHSKK